MADIIERAFRDGKATSWADLAAWLVTNAPHVSILKGILQLTQRAAEDGRSFPSSPEEVRREIRRFERETDPRLH